MVLDINIVINKYTPFNGSTTGKLILDISGNDIDNKIINILRRFSVKYIPTYAYTPETILILKNTSNAYNNDMIKLRISTLPIFNIDPEIDILEEKYWRTVKYNDIEREKHPKEKNITSYINVTNKTSNIINVTTHDIIFKINGETSDIYKQIDPIILIKLHKNEIFTCSFTGTLSIGERHSIWNAVQNSYFDILSDKIIFTLENNGKLNLFDILIKVCNIIIYKIQNLKNELKDEYATDIIIIELIDEDFSFGDVINNEFQLNKKISFSGISKPDLLKNIILIKINNIENTLKNIHHSLDKLINKFEYIEKILIKLNK